MELKIDSFKNLEKNRLLPVLVSWLALIVLFALSGNLVHSAYADTTITAAGDWGCNSNTDNTVDNMDAKNPAVVFGLGDYSYASSGSCWWNKVEADISNPVKIAFGNHEDESSEGLDGYKSHFGISQTYYAYTQDVARVIVMDTDVASFSSGSAQKSFVQNELQSASTNPSIKWIIVYLHKPFYTSSNSCSSTGCTNSDSDTAGTLRNNYGAMFDQYGVDLVLQGHVHNYQRTFQLKYDSGSPSSPTIGSSNANTYTEGNGAVYAIVGTGGAGFHPLSSRASFVKIQQDDDFGQMQIKITNSGNTLEGKYYQNGVNDNNVLFDTFSITKAGNSPPVANNQAVNVIKNTAKSITLTATDANNNPLTYTIVTQPAHGTLSPATPGGPSRTYTPTANYVGPDSFTFKANDGTVDSNTATVSITVAEQPQGSYNYAPSFAATGSTYNDTPDSPSLRLNQFTLAAWFKTSTNFGSDAYIANKGGVGSDSAGQNLNYGIWMSSAEQIRAGFETSSGADQYVTSPNTYNDGQWHYAVVTNNGANVILYIDGLQVATKATSGATPETNTKVFRVGANSRVTPPTNFFTGEIDEVRAWSNALTSSQVASAFGGTFSSGQVLYLSFGGNSPPVANNQAVNVIKNTATPITLTATDANNNPLTYTIVTQPAHGTLSPATPGGPSRTYTPTANYLGPDSFTFKANDGTVDSNTATVSITVAEQPQGGYNYAPSFAATGSTYNDTPDSPSLRLSQFTVAAWFKTSTNFGSEAFIVNKGGIGSDSAGENMNYQISLTSTEQIRVGFETSTGADQFLNSVNTYNDGQWHYVVVTYDGSTLRLYIDGVQEPAKATGGVSPETSGTKPVRIGANSRVTPPTNFFTGEIDEVRVWSDDLTAQEAANAFAGTDFNAAEQKLYLDFSSAALTGSYNYEPSLKLTGPG